MSRLALVLILLALPGRATAADDPRPGDVLVRVNGSAITRADFEFEFVTAGVPEERRQELRRQYLDGLVDSHLLDGFLRRRRATADPKAVDEQVNRIRRQISDRDQNPDEVLRDVGYTNETLRRKLGALPLAWEAYSRQVVRPDTVRQYWEKHQRRFDGTRVRARQILITLPPESDTDAVEEARRKLAELRTQIDAGQLDMAAAAREHSDAPSGKEGGDVGWFPYRGKMPVSFTDHVFALPKIEPGATTAPFRSPFGMHLVQVTAVEPGAYSLEDVREQVFDALAGEVRAGLIEQERAAATIEWAE